MLTTNFKRSHPVFMNSTGFTLVELIVVVVIVGILAAGVVMSFLDPTAKVKAAAFETRGDFNLARAVAVRLNEDILVDFVSSAQATCSSASKDNFDDCFAGGSLHGYVICFDEDNDNDCSDEVRTSPPATAAEVAEDLEEKIIKTTLFHEFVKYYTVGAAAPANGPGADPNGDSLISNNGITFTNDYFSMNSNGTSSDAGSVVIYYPDNPGAVTPGIRGKPYAIELDNVATANVRLQRWRADWDGGKWSNK